MRGRLLGCITMLLLLVPSLAHAYSFGIVPVVAGDLDADGFDDVITVEGPGAYWWGPQWGPVVARNGRTGEALWRFRLSSGFVIPLQLLPERRSDVLVVDLYDMSLRSGPDGAVRWTVPVPRGYDFEWASPIGDASGDGRDDVFVALGRTVCGSLYTCSPRLVAGLGVTLDAMSGRIVSSVASTTDNAERDQSLVFPAFGLAGAPAPNLVTVGGISGTRTVSAYRADTGAPLWSTSFTDRSRFAGCGEGCVSQDLNGDDVPDVALIDTSRFGNWYLPATALDGRDGRVLWSHPSGQYRLAGDVDGDGWADISQFVDEWEQNTYTLRTLSGRTGDVLWTRKIVGDPPEGGSTSYRPCCWGTDEDLNGDGILDTVMQFEEYGPCCPRDGSTHTDAIDGRTGDVLWTTPHPTALKTIDYWTARVGPRSAPIHRGGDITGDGSGDVIGTECSADPCRMRIRSGNDLSASWSVPAFGDGRAHTARLAGGSQLGLVVAGEVGSWVAAYSDGVELWRVEP